jgi:hypothetical protein
MPLGFTPLFRLKRLHACDFWHSSRVFTPLTASHCVNSVQTLKEPKITAAALDMTTEVLSLSLSEAINVDTFVKTDITIQSVAAFGTGTQFFKLTGGVVTHALDAQSLSIKLSEADFNGITVQRGLATTADNVYLTHTTALMEDLFGVDTLSVATSAAFKIETFSADSTSPSLDSWDMDLSDGAVPFFLTRNLHSRGCHWIPRMFG